MEIKTIYKIRYWVHKRVKGEYRDVVYGEIVLVNNLERAKEIYEDGLNEIRQYSSYKNYSGACQLFIPHVFDNGELAYWPDNENYIMQERFE